MLRVEKLSYEIKGRKLLKDISFQVRKGEVLAILGANGAGKSTLMGLLCGDKKPTEGAVILNGKILDSYDVKELSKCRALLSQQQQMTLAFKVSEIVMMGRYPHFSSNPSQNDVRVVEEVMQLCGIHKLSDRVFLSLSGGEQQRVQLARVLAQIWDNPDGLLLLDEPISALDLQYQQKVLAIAKALSRRGFMVVLIIHDVNFAAVYADRIIMLKNGRKLMDGTPVEVLNTKDLYTIFSVESVVELSPKTLKPYVHLEEMILDATVFNSLLPQEESISIERQVDQLIDKFPYLSVEDLARRLKVAESEMWCLDKRNTVRMLRLDQERIFFILSSFGKIKVYSKAKGIKHTLFVEYTSPIEINNNTVRIEDDYFEIGLNLDKWYQGYFVEGDGERSLHFFNEQGVELHAISLIDVVSDSQGLQALKALCLNTTSLGGVNPIVLSAESDKESEVCKHEQSVNAGFVRQIFASCAKNEIPLKIKLNNEGCEQCYSGLIHNLIDQGNRYIIKEVLFELEIVWADVWKIVYHRNPIAHETSYVAFYDTDGILIAELSGILCGESKAWNEVLEGCSRDLVI